MAGNYTVVHQERSIQVLGPTNVLDVQQAGIITRPSGVYVEYPVPLPYWRENQGAAVLDPLASGIEGVIASGLAVGGSYVQDYDVNGLLVDYCDMVVEWRDPSNIRPPQTTTVLIPCAAFVGLTGDPFLVALGGSPQSLLTEAYDHLAALANA